MTVGNRDDKDAINTRIGGVCAGVRDALIEADKLVRYLGSLSDADLQSRTFTADEVTKIRATTTALQMISDGANNRAPLAKDNYMFWPESAIGPN